MGTYKYKAFISYSHKDDRWGRWLHRRLETYPLPRNIVGNVTETGAIPKRLKPIFRDREELAAADNLGDKIEQALSNSENLIMICSPAAARSHWVNQEILYFKRHNRGAQIFSVIVEGEPFASNMPSREDEECFPPALRYQLDEKGGLSDIPAEPLAADLRDHADGKRLGVLKLVSGMIGVGLDEVVQRDMKRTRRRVTTVTTGALATVVAMGTLTGFALDARSEAKAAQAEAEAGRSDAEESIEFMLTDLKSELEKVGSLGALKVVGDRANQYYDKYPVSKHSDEALGRRTRVFHFLGEVLDQEGELDQANGYFIQAHKATEELLLRDPDNTDRIYEHSQSAYWRGYVPFRRGNYAAASEYFHEYMKLAQKLTSIDSENQDWQLESAFANNSLGVLYTEQFKPESALEYFATARQQFEALALAQPGNVDFQIELANVFAWLADTHLTFSPLSVSLNYRKKQMEIYRKGLEKLPNDTRLSRDQMRARISLIDLFFWSGQKTEAHYHADQLIIQAREYSDKDTTNVALQEYIPTSHLKKANLLVADGDRETAEFHLKQSQQTSAQLLELGDMSRKQKLRIFIPQALLEAELLYKNHKYHEALEILSSIFETESNQISEMDAPETELYIQKLLILGNIFETLNRTDDATEHRREIINIAESMNFTFEPNIRIIISETYFRLDLDAQGKWEIERLKTAGVSSTLLTFKTQ